MQKGGALVVLGDQIDSGVCAPPTRPLAPQPDPPRGVVVRPVVGEKPLTHMLELLASHPRVGVEAGEEFAKCCHGGDANRGLGRSATRCATLRSWEGRLAPLWMMD